MVSSILEARDEHISYEQMDAWVEGSMDSDERELVMSHVGLCEFCAGQLKSYEGYAEAMAAPIPSPAQPVLSVGDRIRAFFWTPQVAMIAAGLAVVAILSPLALRRDTARGAVPEALQPAALSPVPLDKGLKYPVSEVVEERQPVLRWETSGGPSTVYLYDSAHREISHQVVESDAAADTHWLVPVPLDRGAVYYWEVRTAVGTSQASFRVLDEAGEKKLGEARASHAGREAVGELEQALGLTTLAEHDFSTLLKENPGSKSAQELLDQVRRPQGH
jgi:hypothetical protein